MRGSFTNSLSRLAIVALVTSSFTIPVILDVSPAMARAAGGAAGAGAGGAGGSSGGSGGGSGGGAGGGHVTKATTITSVDPPRDPPRFRFRAQTLPRPKDPSCYPSQPMFDRWGDYVGKQQLPDFCY
jgi:hypothetical protein